MPRSDKPINPTGRLDDPVSSSRAVRWTKYGGIETADGVRGAPTTVEVTVDDITVIDEAPPTPSKWEQRGASAQIAADSPSKPAVEPEKVWVVDRVIEGRTYRRTDALVAVELPSES